MRGEAKSFTQYVVAGEETCPYIVAGPVPDLDRNGTVDLVDFATFAVHFPRLDHAHALGDESVAGDLRQKRPAARGDEGGGTYGGWRILMANGQWLIDNGE